MPMTDIEMDLIMAKAEIITLQDTVRRQENMIANQRTHIASLQVIIEDLRKQLDGGSDG